MANDIIRRDLKAVWLLGAGNPQVRTSLHADSGGTDAILLKADVRIELAVKVHLEDAKEEARGYRQLCKGPRSLAGHLLHPLKTAGVGMWVTPFLDGQTLHDIVFAKAGKHSKSDEQYLLELYDDFLSMMKALWVETKVETKSDLKLSPAELYLQRVRDGVSGINTSLVLPAASHFSLSNTPIRIEYVGAGVHDDPENFDFGKEFRQFEDGIRAATAHVSHLCTIHGDEHAKNVMIDNNDIGQNPKGWTLIDYVKSNSQRDWVFSIAKMLFWWEFYGVLECARKDSQLRAQLNANYRVSNGTLFLSYNRDALEEHTPSICSAFTSKLYALGDEVASEFGEGSKWRDRLNYALFSVVFGSVYRRLRDSSTEFAAPIMIGEGLRLLKHGSNLYASAMRRVGNP